MSTSSAHSQFASHHLSDRGGHGQRSVDGVDGMAEVIGVASLEMHTETLCDPVEAYFECITTCSLDDGECITTCTELLREQV